MLFGFPRLRVDIHNRLFAFARTRIHAAENELLRSGNFQQGEILEGRTDEDQVIVLGVVHRKEAPALYQNLPMQQSQNTIHLLHAHASTHATVHLPTKPTLTSCAS